MCRFSSSPPAAPGPQEVAQIGLPRPQRRRRPHPALRAHHLALRKIKQFKHNI